MTQVILLFLCMLISCKPNPGRQVDEKTARTKVLGNSDRKPDDITGSIDSGNLFYDIDWNDFRSGRLFAKKNEIKPPYVVRKFSKDKPGVLSGLEIVYNKNRFIKVDFDYYEGMMTYSFRKIFLSGKDTAIRVGVFNNNKHFLFECAPQSFRNTPLEIKIYSLRVDTVIKNEVHSRIIDLGRSVKIRDALLINTRNFTTYFKEYWLRFVYYSVLSMENGQIFETSTTETDYAQSSVPRISISDKKELIYSRNYMDFNNSISFALLFWEKERYPD